MFSFLDIIVFLLITFYSNPLSLEFIPNEILFPILFLISLRFITVVKIDKYIALFFIVILFSIIFHFLNFRISFLRDIGILLTMLTSFLLISSKGYKFLISFVKIVYFLILISIPFWLSFNFFILLFGLDVVTEFLRDFSFEYSGNKSDLNLKQNDRFNFLVFFNYTNNPSLYFRNHGYMWEPGQFAAYISYSLIFMDILKSKFSIKIPKYYYYVHYLGLLSSFSTAGYIIMFFHVVISNLSRSIKNVGSFFSNNFFFIILFTSGSIIFAINTDFIATKILTQYTNDITSYNFYAGRLNIAFMIQQIIQNPLFGSGTFLISTTDIFATQTFSSINGYLVFARSWGIIAFILMNLITYYSMLYCFNEHRVALLYFILFILIAMSQNLFLSFLAYILMFFYNYSYTSKELNN